MFSFPVALQNPERTLKLKGKIDLTIGPQPQFVEIAIH